MRIAVLGGDGYCGWATALYLSSKGHSVAIVDNYSRRHWDFTLGVQTLTPIRPLTERLRVWQQLTGRSIDLFVGDATDYDFLASTIETFQPDTIVHFAEQRSFDHALAGDEIEADGPECEQAVLTQAHAYLRAALQDGQGERADALGGQSLQVGIEQH